MVDLSIVEGRLALHVRGADQLWAFKGSLEIPLAHIAGVRADPAVAHGWCGTDKNRPLITVAG